MSSCKRHKEGLTIPAWYPGDVGVTPEQLSLLLGDLRYDALAKYLAALAEKLWKDSESDGGRGRGQLSEALERAAYDLEEAAASIRHAWRICEPYMKETD